MTEHTPDLLPCPFCGGTADGPHFIRDGRSIACRCGSRVVAYHGKYNTDEHVTGLWNRRSPDLLTEVTRLRAVNAELVEALTEAESVFALAEQPRGKDRDHGPEVTEIGRRIGFGALMTSAQASWREYATERGHAGSEFVAGPCYSTVLSTLNMIRAALRAAEEASK